MEDNLRVDRTLAFNADLDVKLAALTPDDVHAALKKHLDTKRLVVVVAGDFEQVGSRP
jgi:zinc protease